VSAIALASAIHAASTVLLALHKRLENMEKGPCAPFSFGVYCVHPGVIRCSDSPGWRHADRTPSLACKETIMAQTTFSGPVTSQNGFNSDDTPTTVDYVSGSYNLTDFTVRPASTWTGTVAALVGAANSRTAGVSGANIFGCYAQTSMGTATTLPISLYALRQRGQAQ